MRATHALLAVALTTAGLPHAPGHQEEQHPQEQYRDRPAGIRVTTTDDSPPTTQAQALISRLEHSRRRAEIGTDTNDRNHVLGEVAGVAIGPNEDVIYVLDSSFREVRVFDTDGSFISRVGGPGEGPGEFIAPSALALNPERQALYVADRASRVEVFTGAPDSLGAERRIRLESVTAKAACLFTDELVVVDRKVHTYLLDGTPRREFGTIYASPNRQANSSLGSSLALCIPAHHELVLAAVNLGEVKLYDSDAVLQWVFVLPEFEAGTVTISGPMLTSGIPDNGMDEIGSITSLSTDFFLVQVIRVRRIEDPRRDPARSYLISRSGQGWELGVDLPHYMALSENLAVAIELRPDPVLIIHELSE